MQKFILLIFTILIFSSCETKDKPLMSIKGVQNDTVVSLVLYDRKGRVIFDKTTQIIGDWDNDLMTWIYSDFYFNDRKIATYYAHSNLTLSKTIYDYDAENKLRETYTISVPKPEKRETNLYKEIYLINNPDTLKKFIENKLSKNDTLFKLIKSERDKKKYFFSKIDDNGILTKEFGILIDTFQLSKTIEKYDDDNNIISIYHKSLASENLNEFKYDKNGNLIEETDNHNGSFQKKTHIYEKGNLIKTNLYHDKELAFTYEYFYRDTLLIQEIKTRLTNSKYFENRKLKEIIDYEYKYYE